MELKKMAAKYLVTAYSRLARARVAISSPMGEEDARKLLDRMEQHAASSKYRRGYLHPRIERIKPIQLTLKFKDDEQSIT